MNRLRFASCMAENSEPICRAVAGYVRSKLALDTEYVGEIPWQERERLFDAGEIQVPWLCGLPYVRKADSLPSRMELLAVPVPAGARYENRPVYFSDVVVHRESPCQNFSDLRGRAWAFNETRSHSGYNVVRAHLAGLGAYSGFFAKTVEAGAHTLSLKLILDRRVDGAAVDSTVLEWVLAFDPEMRNSLRVIQSLGPSPIPPWVISTAVPAEQRQRLRSLLSTMGDDRAGSAILSDGRMARFVESRDGDYDPIRRMAVAAEPVTLAP